MIVEDVIYWIQ